MTAEAPTGTTRPVVSPTKARISIIVPVLNEAALIHGFLHNLHRHAPGAEVIVVDGGSTDGTAALAEELCDRVLTTRANRAVQMNAGARVATGNVLWFVHSDALVPARCLEEIIRVLADPRVAGGYFRIALPRSRLVYRLTDSFAHYAGLFLRMRCGDHAMFCRREVFHAVGGFPELPVLEDVEFFRAACHAGPMRVISRRLVADPRRYEQIGPVRLTLAYGLIAALYCIGVRIPILDVIYRRLCCR